jgi:heptosyltransferase III
MAVSPLLDRLPPHSRVAVIRLRSLGDCVLTTPALALLHQHRPDLRIAVAVEPRFAAIFEYNPAITRILDDHRLAARKFAPALCLNLHGGARSVWLTALSGARHRAGFAHHAHRWLYNAKIPRAQSILGEERTVHTAEHLASAMFWLGVPRQEIPRAALYATPEKRTPYAVIHPFASAAHKMWPAENFLALAHHLQAQGLAVVITGAPSDDFTSFRAFECAQNNTLTQTKNLLAGATLFLGNDSGPAHMAAAFGLPVVVLYGTSDPVVWAPWRTPHRTFVSPAGLARIAPATVIAAVGELLAGVATP